MVALRPEHPSMSTGCVVAELVDFETVEIVKTRDIQQEIKDLRTLNHLKAEAIRKERQLNHVRSVRVKAIQDLDVSLELTGTPVERLLEAGKAATLITQHMPEDAATIFITAVVNAAMKL